MQICNYENYDVLHPDAQPAAHQQLPQLSPEVGELLLLQLGLMGDLLPRLPCSSPLCDIASLE